jgi:hypothetical protein
MVGCKSGGNGKAHSYLRALEVFNISSPRRFHAAGDMGFAREHHERP